MKENRLISCRLKHGIRFHSRPYLLMCPILWLFLVPCNGEGFSPTGKQGTTAGILFRIGDSVLDVNYKNNRSVLDTFMIKLNSVLSDSNYVVNELKITGAASPDGKREEDNILLAGLRASSLRRYVLSHSKLTPSAIKIENKGENWESLRAMVASSGMRYKKEVLRILDSVPNRNKRKNKLMFLHHSIPYMYMYKTFFPILRSGIGCATGDTTGNSTGNSSGMSLSYKLTESAAKRLEKLRADSVKLVPHAKIQLSAVRSDKQPEETSRTIERINIMEVRPGAWTIGTNLAYDGILLPNIELQSALSRHMSVAIEGMCAWWSSDKTHKYYQIAGLSPELRYWPGKEVLAGRYVGALFMGGLYDLENGGKGFQGEYLAAGMSMGYVLKVGGSFWLDFGIGAGALLTQYRKYNPEGGKYVYRYTGKHGYFGPLKAKIELVWRPWKKIKKEEGGRK